jgi:hypothetical protein
MDTFMTACRLYFGLLPDQRPMDFGKEFIRLTDADKKEIYEGFQKNGVECEAPVYKPQ